MLTTKSILIFISILLVQAPFISGDTFDDARAQLEELKQIAKSAISDGRVNITMSWNNIVSISSTTFGYTMDALHDQQVIVETKISDLQLSLRRNPINTTSCFTNVSTIDDLYWVNFEACFACDTYRGDFESPDYYYLIDSQYNVVDSLEFRLGVCSDNDQNCAQVVLDQIIAQKVDLPNSIQAVADGSQEYFDRVKDANRKCFTDLSGGYQEDTNAILETITNCVDALVGTL